MPGSFLPLSSAQRRLWFLDQLRPGSALTTSRRRFVSAETSTAVRSPPLSPRSSVDTRCCAPLSDPIRRAGAGGHRAPRDRHAGYRPSRRYPQPCADVETQRLAARRAPVFLSISPRTWRCGLRCWPCPAESHVALVNLHHIAGDGWSMAISDRASWELSTRPIRQGRPNPLPELRIQYADYAVWQRRQLSRRGDGVGAGLVAAAARREAASRSSCLPTGRAARSPTRAERLRSLAVPLAALGGLTEVSRRFGATRFMALLAVFAAFLQRFAGQDDLTVGTPIAGRTRIELEDLIGFFVNTLALRLDFGSDPEVGELLERSGRRRCRPTPIRSCPSNGWSRSWRRIGSSAGRRWCRRCWCCRTPLRICFPSRAWTLSTTPLGHWNGKVRSDLRFHGDRGALCRERSSMTPDCSTARRSSVWQDISSACWARLSGLRNGGFRSCPCSAGRAPAGSGGVERLDSCCEAGRLCRSFSRARRSAIPAARRSSVGHEMMTYGELAARAGRLALSLRALGVAPEEPVALCFERSPAVLVAMLGVLEAGCAYLPLDRGSPVSASPPCGRTPAGLCCCSERRLASVPRHRSRAGALPR